MESLLTEYAPYIAVATAIVILADRVAKLTPTKSDDKVVEWIYKIFAVIGLKVEDNKGKQ